VSKALKLSAWRAGILILLLGLVVWRNFFFYPRVWNARITVDSAVCRDCAVYVGRGRIGGVLIRRAEQQVEFYSVAFPNPDLEVPNGAVWKCNAGAFSLLPGVALHGLAQSYAPWGFPSAQAHVRVSSRLIEFTPGDGKRITAEWR